MVRRLVNEIALQEYKMDPFVGMSLFANVTKLCVVMHYLQQHKNQLGEKDQPGTSYMKLIGTHEFDDCSDNLVVPQHQKPKLIDNDDEKTVNVMFNESHYMVLKNGTSLKPYGGYIEDKGLDNDLNQRLPPTK